MPRGVYRRDAHAGVSGMQRRDDGVCRARALVRPQGGMGTGGRPEAYRASIRALLRAPPPPGVIFSPGRHPAVMVWLHTADHIRRASPVQKEQGTRAPGDRTRIMRFAVGDQDDPVALVFTHHRQGIFSVPLPHYGLLVAVLSAEAGAHAPSRPCTWLPHGRTSEVFFR